MKKKANKKGFTIMEMLIVVAIIAVLVAIAIPTFNGALTKAKEATDVANIRAAYAELQVKILTENATVPDQTTADTNFWNSADKKSNAATYTYTKNADGTATVTYVASKLTGGNGATDKTFSWTINSPDIQ